MNPYYPEFGRLDVSGFFERVWFNLRAYGGTHIPITVAPFPYRSTYSPPLWQRTSAPWWLAAPLLALIVVGAVRQVRRFDPAAWATVVSIVLVLSWPPVWAANRFLIPLAPLLFWLLWEGLRLDLARPIVWARGRGVVMVLFLVFAALTLRNYYAETRAYDPVWKNYFETIRWVAQNTPPDALIIDRKPGFVEFLSGRSARTFPREANLDRMIDFFRGAGADYVLLNRLPYDDIGRYLVPVVNERPQHFEIQFRIDDPERDPALNGDAYVFQFLP
ncbi:MAG: hypothetical protein R3E12_07930 [Candidatus Eisenbacteria bacterium]